LHTRLAYQDDDNDDDEDEDDDDDDDDDDDFMARALKSGIRSEFFQSVRRTRGARGARVSARAPRIRRKREGRKRRGRRRSIGFLDGMSPVSHPKWRGASVRSTHTSGRSSSDRSPRLEASWTHTTIERLNKR